MSGPDSAIGESIQHEFEGWGFESPSGRDIFCLKNFDTFTRTAVRVSKMNAVARAQFPKSVTYDTQINGKLVFSFTIWK